MNIFKWFFSKEVVRTENVQSDDLEISKIEDESIAVCPYCEIELEIFPKRKSKCKHCKNTIYLRVFSGSNSKKLLTELQMNEFDIEKEKFHQNRERFSTLRLFGISEEDYNRLEDEYCSNNDSFEGDVFWPILNNLIDNNECQSNKLDLNYYSMATFFHQSGQDNFRLLQLNAKQTLDTYQQSSLVQDFQIIAAKDSCENCRKNDGKILSLDEAYLLPVPCKECDHSIGFCRCMYVAISRRDNEGRLIKKNNF